MVKKNCLPLYYNKLNLDFYADGHPQTGPCFFDLRYLTLFPASTCWVCLEKSDATCCSSSSVGCHQKRGCNPGPWKIHWFPILKVIVAAYRFSRWIWTVFLRFFSMYFLYLFQLTWKTWYKIRCSSSFREYRLAFSARWVAVGHHLKVWFWVKVLVVVTITFDQLRTSRFQVYIGGLDVCMDGWERHIAQDIWRFRAHGRTGPTGTIAYIHCYRTGCIHVTHGLTKPDFFKFWWVVWWNIPIVIPIIMLLVIPPKLG